MKYQINQVSLPTGMFFGIYIGRKLYRVYTFKSEAEIEMQRIIEDDKWHAANRD